MEILGYISAALIGVVLGIIGGGGSILTVPVLVYLFNISPLLSTSYSLIIVGVTSLIGVITYQKSKNVNYSTGIVFSIPALIAVYLTRRFVIPSFPEQIFSINGVVLNKDIMIMLLFSSLMVFASISMIKDITFNFSKFNRNNFSRILFITFEGFLVGFLTGLVGAGGGFLIIPALVVFANLPMKLAVGTSLFIIAVKSLIGFTGDLGTGLQIDWYFLIIFTAIAIMGMIIGSRLSHKMNANLLKPVFGWFVLGAGILIIFQNIFTMGGL
ncbi:MAG: sulfite exporter TauE/SafE family protein [Melioribacteraceae bacterium]|nr:sulfite exporter TauE/SafE family protein [Melioribacteraceae bacterium]